MLELAPITPRTHLDPHLYLRLTHQPDAMNLRPHDEQDGKKVWLSEAEVSKLGAVALVTENRLKLF